MRHFFLILFSMLSSISVFAAKQPVAKGRWVICGGAFDVKNVYLKNIDKGSTKFQFLLTQKHEIKNIQIQTRFRKIPAQNISAVEAKAATYGMIRSPSSAQSFFIGNNGACNFGLSYEGQKLHQKGAQRSWGILALGCGSFGAEAKVSCEIR